LARNEVCSSGGVGAQAPSTEKEIRNPLHVDLSLIMMLELTEWAATVKHAAFSEERE